MIRLQSRLLRPVKAAASHPGRRWSHSGKSDNIWERYLSLLERRPLSTKAVTAGVIAAASDITCQSLDLESRNAIAVSVGSGDVGASSTQREGGGQGEEYGEEEGWAPAAQPEQGINWARVAKYGLLGTILVAPTLHVWYGVLSRRLPGTTVPHLVRRVFLDQFVFTPPFVAVMLSTLQVADGAAARVPDKLKQDFLPTLVSNWGVWMPAMAINFRFMPPRLQVLFSNCVGFFWNVYFSYRAYRGVPGGNAAPPNPGQLPL